MPATIRWLVSRQTVTEDDDSDDDGIGPAESDEPPSMAKLSVNEADQVGCNGRCNKKADTCYCFWVGASLEMLGQAKLANKEGFRRFLLEQTEHRIGGFGKCPGYPPDLYHAYLGLASLSLMGEPGLKPVHPAFVITQQAKENLDRVMEDVLAAKTVYHVNGMPWVVSELDSNYEKRIAEDEGRPEAYEFYRRNLKDYEAMKVAADPMSRSAQESPAT